MDFYVYVLTAFGAALIGATASFFFSTVMNKGKFIMERRERLLNQALKVKRIQRFKYYDRPENWELAEEIDILKTYLEVYASSLGFFRCGHRKRLFEIYHELQDAEPEYKYVDGKPIPQPQFFSDKRIDILKKLIRELI